MSSVPCARHSMSPIRPSSSPRRAMSSTLPIVTALILLSAMAYASPPDPSWVAGIYDAADGDDSVTCIYETVGVEAASPPPVHPLPRLSAILLILGPSFVQGFCAGQFTRGPPLVRLRSSRVPARVSSSVPDSTPIAAFRQASATLPDVAKIDAICFRSDPATNNESLLLNGVRDCLEPGTHVRVASLDRSGQKGGPTENGGCTYYALTLAMLIQCVRSSKLAIGPRMSWSELWQRAPLGPASESGRLCHRDRDHGRGDRRRRALMLAIFGDDATARPRPAPEGRVFSLTWAPTLCWPVVCRLGAVCVPRGLRHA